jgi:uncharacterized protein YdeI (YjbR/CyaY-like superfamily)
MSEDSTIERLEPEDREEWRGWLDKNHGTSRGVFLVTRKKSNTGNGVSYEEAVQEAVAFGWIDSRVNRLDESSFLQLYTPRKPGSTWSKTNKDRVARMTAQGRMAPAGLKKVRAAKRDGSWTLLDRVEALRFPAELIEALSDDPRAKKNFEDYPDSIKKRVIFWIESAKRTETRDRRIREIVELARAGRQPWAGDA